MHVIFFLFSNTTNSLLEVTELTTAGIVSSWGLPLTGRTSSERGSGSSSGPSVADDDNVYVSFEWSNVG
jgi:hypothetical protein